MFLKYLIDHTKTLGFKVSAWYSTFYIISSFFLFGITYYFISVTLTNQDHEEIFLELSEIASVYENNGIKAVENFISQSDNLSRTKPLFIRIADDENKTIQIFNKKFWGNFNISFIENFLLDNSKKWLQIDDFDRKYVLDVTSTQLSNGQWIQVGMSSEGRVKILNNLSKIFIVIMILLFVIGLIGGIFLSYLTLRPIRNVIESVQSIEVGKMAKKLPRPMTGDELDELTELFNHMIENINRLILNMKNSLDNVAHDLRTPLTRLRNLAEMALLENSQKDTQINALQTCLEESDQILKILDTIMDISEAESGSMNIDLKVENISKLSERIIDMYQIVADEKKVKINSSIPDRLELMIDATRIGQVIANVFDNAIKFTPAEGTIDFAIFPDNNKIKIVIKDTGIGIPKEDLPKIWNRLYRGDQSRTSKGFGLGLSIAKGIVEAHHGKIELDSEPNKGTTFTIALPK